MTLIDDASISIRNADEIPKPFIYTYKGETDIESFGNKIYVSPFLKETIEENPLSGSDRQSPLDFTYPVKVAFRAKVFVPEGYIVDYLASEEVVNNDDYDFKYLATEKNGVIHVECSYYIKKSVYPIESYQSLQQLFNMVVEKSQEKVVLAKA